jgi:hypothetical protein
MQLLKNLLSQPAVVDDNQDTCSDCMMQVGSEAALYKVWELVFPSMQGSLVTGKS